MVMIKDKYIKYAENVHPRIYTNKKRIDFAKELTKKDERLQRWLDKILYKAQCLLGEDGHERVSTCSHGRSDGIRLDGTGDYRERSLLLNFAYYMTHDKKYADLLWELTEAICNWKDWNADNHYLCTAIISAGVAMTYDWCFDYLSEEQKKIISDAIMEKALIPAKKLYKEEKGFTINTYNWNAVCNSAVMMSAAAIADESDIDFCMDIINDSINSVKKILFRFAPDGAWSEGVAYWDYTLYYLVPYAASLKSCFGEDFGVMSSEGIDKTGYFGIYMTGNTGKIFNFHDSKDFAEDKPEFFWLGNEYNDDNLIKFRIKQIEKEGFEPCPKDFFWLFDELPENYNDFTLPLERMFRDTESASFRSDFSMGAYAAIHGGYNAEPHGQLDAGQFIYELYGIRWAEDLGSDYYILNGYFDVENKIRWHYYRNRAEGHNTVVINADDGRIEDQDIEATAKITEFNFDAKLSGATVDMTDVFKKYVDKYSRKFSLNKEDSTFVIADEIKFKEGEHSLHWFMHTKAEIELMKNNKIAKLSMNNKSVYVSIISNGEESFEVLNALPLGNCPNPDISDGNIKKGLLQDKNVEYKKLGIYKKDVRGKMLIRVAIGSKPLEEIL